MKKLALVVFAALLCVSLGNVGAEETTGADWDVDCGSCGDEYFEEWLNENCIDHTHNYTDRYEADTNTQSVEYVPERRNPVGVGTDILIWDNEDVGVSHEYKYDWQNDEHSNYVVLSNKKSLWSMIKGNGNGE